MTLPLVFTLLEQGVNEKGGKLALTDQAFPPRRVRTNVVIKDLAMDSCNVSPRNLCGGRVSKLFLLFRLLRMSQCALNSSSAPCFFAPRHRWRRLIRFLSRSPRWSRLTWRGMKIMVPWAGGKVKRTSNIEI